MTPLFLPAMEQQREQETKSSSSDEPRKKKRRIERDKENCSQWEDSSIVHSDFSWNGCPSEVQMHILDFVQDPNVVRKAIAAKDSKKILEYMKPLILLLSVDKKMNVLALDKIGKINGEMLKIFPRCLLRFVRKAANFRCRYPLQLPTCVELSSEKNIISGLLEIASSCGHIEFCERLIDAGVFKDSVINNKELVRAIYLHDKSAVKKLIENKQGEALFKNGANQLMMASTVGDFGVLKLLLGAKFGDLNAITNDGTTALMFAAQNGHSEVMELLLRNGANLDQQDNNGLSAFMRAAWGGHIAAMELLLANGAVIDQKSRTGLTAVMMAARGGHKAAMRWLFASSAFVVDQRDKNGLTAFIHAAQCGHRSAMNLLLKKGAAMDSADPFGETALILASRNGHKEVIRFLLDSGAVVDQVCVGGRTALMGAAGNGHRELVKLLLERGAVIDRQGVYGNVALINAASQGYEDIVKLLLDEGATANLHVALERAQSKGHLNIVELLKRHLGLLD